MWKGSPATTAFATFSHRAVSGSPREAPQAETVDGLGNRKNDLGQQNHRRERVEPYGGSVKLIRQLRHQGFKIAVVTSSQNCTIVLKAAKVDDFFDAQGAHLVVNDLGELVSRPSPQHLGSKSS